jgi:NADPH:quinone reductase-like Zn-dependent oxidoreductase
MQAIAVNEYGAEPRIMELPKPKPGPGQILIKIWAAGMNPMDRMISAGEWKAVIPGQFPLVLGADVAGVVEAVGENATRFSSGDVVFGQLFIAPVGSAGTYAEYVAVSEDANLARVPKKLDAVVAAALPTAGVTALGIVESLGRLSGKTVLIIGAGGGVGSFATQFAAQNGAHVDANARADAAARMRSYGAAETFDHTAVSLLDAVRRAHPVGVDVVIDLASDRDGFATAAALVRRGGTALSTRRSADVESLAKAGIRGVNFQVSMSPGALQRVADAVVKGRIVPPPINRIELGDVPATWSNGCFDGKTVIVL